VTTFVEWLLWVESTALAVWVGESRYGFQLALVLHALSMGLLAGGNVVLGLRVLGVAPGVPMAALQRFYPWLWAAALLCLVSGLMLLSVYPAKALTNPVFFSKMALLGLGLWCMAGPLSARLRAGSTSPRLGGTVLLVWALTISGGRLLAYTHSVLRASELMGG
jgi:hypothetical protein